MANWPHRNETRVCRRMKAVWAERQLESALIFPLCRMMKAGIFTQSYLKAIFNERFH